MKFSLYNENILKNYYNKFNISFEGWGGGFNKGPKPLHGICRYTLYKFFN